MSSSEKSRSAASGNRPLRRNPRASSRSASRAQALLDQVKRLGGKTATLEKYLATANPKDLNASDLKRNLKGVNL